MKVIPDSPISFEVLIDTLGSVASESLAVEKAAGTRPGSPTLATLLSGVSSAAAQKARLIEALEGSLKSAGLPAEFAALATEMLRKSQGPEQSAVLEQIRGGLAGLLKVSQQHEYQLQQGLEEALRAGFWSHYDQERAPRGDPAAAIAATAASIHGLSAASGLPKERIDSMLTDLLLEYTAAMNPGEALWAWELRSQLGLKISETDWSNALRASFLRGRSESGSQWEWRAALQAWGPVMSHEEREHFLSRSYLRMLSFKGPAADEVKAVSRLFDLSRIPKADLRTAFLQSAPLTLQDNGFRYPARSDWPQHVQNAVSDEDLRQLLLGYINSAYFRDREWRDNALAVIAKHPELADLASAKEHLYVGSVDLLELARASGGGGPIGEAIERAVREDYRGGASAGELSKFVERLEASWAGAPPAIEGVQRGEIAAAFETLKARLAAVRAAPASQEWFKEW